MDYKEKLRLAKEALDSGSYDKETIEYIFPELAESEDERIRREIINYFKCQSRDEPARKDIHNKWINWLKCIKISSINNIDKSFIDDIKNIINEAPEVLQADKNKLVAWLEKQGEQQPVKAFYTTIVETGNGGVNTVVKRKLSTDECYGKQKPAEKTTWYDNMDDLTADAMIDDIKNADMPEHCKHNRITWINKHRGKPAEWSEEDEKVTKWVIDYIGNCPNENFDFYGGVGKEAVLSWLNKLKDILQSQPKQDSTDRFFEGFKKGEQFVIENYGKYGLCKLTEWSEEDKRTFSNINLYIRKAGDYPHFNKENIKEAINWLKSLKERMKGE